MPNCETQLGSQPTHHLCDIVLLKQVDRANASSAHINAGCSVFQRNATEREYRNFLLASLTQLVEAASLRCWRVLLFKHRSEESEVGAVGRGTSNLSHGVTRNTDQRA